MIMSKYLTALSLCAAIALTVAPMHAIAQTTPSTDTETAPGAAPEAQAETQTPPPAADGAPSVEDQLSLGEDAETAVGQPYTKEKVGAWDMRCIRTEEGEDPCQMYQLLLDDQGAPVAEFSLFRLPAGGKAVAGATVVVPLETALQQQLTVTVDGGKPRRYPFAFCNPVGCYVRLGMTAEDVAAYKRGNLAKLSIVPVLAPDQKVELDLSLEGFTASFDKVSLIEQQ
jgi:invasion protein IalB